MHRAAREVVALVEEVAAATGLTATELDVLGVLVDCAPSAVSGLLAESGYKPSTLTAILDRLVARGWVSREVHPDDRRSFVVTLTTAGRRAARALDERLAPLEREVVRGIPRAEVDALLGLPARLEAVARRARTA